MDSENKNKAIEELESILTRHKIIVIKGREYLKKSKELQARMDKYHAESTNTSKEK